MKKDYGIAPQTCLEMGLVSLEQDCLENSKVWLNKTMNQYHDYWTKITVHMRVERARKRIKEKEKEKDDKMTMMNHY